MRKTILGMFLILFIFVGCDTTTNSVIPTTDEPTTDDWGITLTSNSLDEFYTQEYLKERYASGDSNSFIFKNTENEEIKISFGISSNDEISSSFTYYDFNTPVEEVNTPFWETEDGTTKKINTTTAYLADFSIKSYSRVNNLLKIILDITFADCFEYPNYGLDQYIAKIVEFNDESYYLNISYYGSDKITVSSSNFATTGDYFIQ